MSKNTNNSSSHEPKQIEQAIEGCELNLSADKKWMRLVVDGKLTASFHVNYVNKVLGNEPKKSSERVEKRQEPTANL